MTTHAKVPMGGAPAALEAAAKTWVEAQGVRTYAELGSLEWAVLECRLRAAFLAGAAEGARIVRAEMRKGGAER